MEAKLARIVRVLTVSQLVGAIGDGSFYVTSALFLARVVGLSAGQTGLWLSIAWATGFALSTPLGQLADALELRRAAVTLSAAVAIALVLATQVRNHLGFLAVLTTYAVAQSGLIGVRQAIVSTAVPAEVRVTVRARLHVVVNAGIGAGALIGGVALSVGTAHAFVVVFWLDALAFTVAAWLISRLATTRPGSTQRSTRPMIGGVFRDRPYVTAAALSAVLYLYMPMLSVVLPLFLARHTSAPTWTVAAVFLTNTAGVIALQVRAARTVVNVRSATVAARRGGIALGLACLVFAVAAIPTSPTLVVAVIVAGAVVQVVGEVLLGAGSWHIGFALADPDRPGEWQGLYSSGLPLARSIGPLALSALILTWSGPGWIVLAIVFAGFGIALRPVALWGEQQRPAPIHNVPAHT
jgi:MFS family permease